jgi:hypothetical protein
VQPTQYTIAGVSKRLIGFALSTVAQMFLQDLLRLIVPLRGINQCSDLIAIAHITLRYSTYRSLVRRGEKSFISATQKDAVISTLPSRSSH